MQSKEVYNLIGLVKDFRHLREILIGNMKDEIGEKDESQDNDAIISETKFLNLLCKEIVREASVGHHKAKPLTLILFCFCFHGLALVVSSLPSLCCSFSMVHSNFSYERECREVTGNGYNEIEEKCPSL